MPAACGSSPGPSMSRTTGCGCWTGRSMASRPIIRTGWRRCSRRVALLISERCAVALQLQEELLAPQSAAVAAQPAVFVHDAVAGDEDGHAILAIGAPDGTLGA